MQYNFYFAIYQLTEQLYYCITSNLYRQIHAFSTDIHAYLTVNWRLIKLKSYL